MGCCDSSKIEPPPPQPMVISLCLPNNYKDNTSKSEEPLAKIEVI